MANLMFIHLLLFLFHQPIYSCAEKISKLVHVSTTNRNLSHELDQLKKKQEGKLHDAQQELITEYRDQQRGKWIQAGSYPKYFFRYDITGEVQENSNPIFAFGGLGSSLDRALNKNQILHRSKLSIPIEYEGQGAVEVSSQASRPDYDAINLDYLAGNAASVVKLLQAEDVGKNSPTLQGHSFGGLMAIKVASELEQPVRLQLLASGVSTFNNRFYSPYQSVLSMGLGHTPLTRIKNFLIDERVLPYLSEDPLKLEAAARLTLGSADDDGVKLLSKIQRQGSEVQIFTAEKDNFVFPMLHFELAEKSSQLGLPFAHIIVEGTDHYLPETLTDSQAKIVAYLAEHGLGEYQGYFRLPKKLPKRLSGDLRRYLKPLSRQEAFEFCSNRSQEMFAEFKDLLRETFFGTLEDPSLPRHWVNLNSIGLYSL